MGDGDGVQLGYGDARLTFHTVEQYPSGGDYTTVELDVFAVHVSMPVDLDTHAGSLSDFFDSLAACWRGWDGPRGWVNVEGDFRLSCHHDVVGHVVAIVTLGLVPPHEWHAPGWSITATVVVDPGALDDFANSLRQALNGR